MKKLLLTTVFAGLLGLNASAKVAEGQIYGDWKGACDGGECAVIQIANDRNNQPLAQVVLMKSPDKKHGLPCNRAAGRGFARRHEGGNRPGTAGGGAVSGLR